MKCPNCGGSDKHFVPPSLGEPGFFLCDDTTKAVAVSVKRQLSKWDLRFMEMAKMVASWSKDPSTKTGAVLVSPDRTDVAIGFNGFARRMKDDPAIYANRPVKYSRIVHCEMNAVMLARRSVAGYTLYTWPFLSCDRCAVHMVQAGIVRAVAPTPPADQASRWAESLDKTKAYFREAGVEVVEYDLATGEY